MSEPFVDEEGPVAELVAEFGAICPYANCGAIVNVGVLAQWSMDDDGNQMLQLHPDLTDIWAHSFTHEES